MMVGNILFPKMFASHYSALPVECCAAIFWPRNEQIFAKSPELSNYQYSGYKPSKLYSVIGKSNIENRATKTQGKSQKVSSQCPKVTQN